MEWDKLWALNKQIIDPVVPRYMAVSKGTSQPLHSFLMLAVRLLLTPLFARLKPREKGFGCGFSRPPRCCAGEGVPVSITGAPNVVTTQLRRLHAKNEQLGQVPLYLYDKILIEGDDAQLCQDGEEVLFFLRSPRRP